jgi:hypothetical protein
MVRACVSCESMFRVFEMCVRGFWLCVVYDACVVRVCVACVMRACGVCVFVRALINMFVLAGLC